VCVCGIVTPCLRLAVVARRDEARPATVTEALRHVVHVAGEQDRTRHDTARHDTTRHDGRIRAG
jgi:hypothetical protein